MRVVATVFIAAALVAGRVEASRGLSESPKPKPEPSPMCETCEEFVTLGEAYLNDPATLNAIADKVNEVCETYAGTKHESMVRANNTSPLPPLVRALRSPDRLTRACNFQIWEGQETRPRLSTETSPRPAHLADRSTHSFRSLVSQCESLLEMYVQKAIDVINTDFTPDVLCADAKLCPEEAPNDGETRAATEPPDNLPASLREVIERGSAVDAPAPPPSTDCLKCEFGVESLHAAITSNATVQSLLNEAEKACEKYAAAFDMSATCEAAIETYGPELVNAAGKYIEDAHKVCSELGMCTPPSETVTEADSKKTRRRERMKKLKARAMAIAGLKLKNIALI